MPPKKGLNLSNLKAVKKADAERKSTQITISKFFAPKVEGTSKTNGCPAIITDDTNRNDGKPMTSSQTKKRSRETEAGSPDSRSKKVCFDSEQQCKDSSLSVLGTTSVSVKTKERLQNFSVSEKADSETGPSTSEFDFTVLKREKASLLPDLNESENTQEIVTAGKEDDSSQEDMEISETGDSQAAKKLSLFSAGSSNSGVGPSNGGGDKNEKRKSSILLKGKSGPVKYTQLEQQVVDIKQNYPDALLFVECGYKYRFFGEDAEIAAKVLKIFCHLDHSFMTASIPVHRLFVHIRRLVAAGYKVGVVKQTETAALKAAGSNRSAPFTRQLTALYTKSTLIGQDVDPLSGEATSDDSTQAVADNTYLMCVCDSMPGKKPKTHMIGIVAVQPSTGDIIYDCFEDTQTRSELETRVSHIQPVELLMSQTVTSQSERTIQGLQLVSENADDRMRLEKLDSSLFEYNTSFKMVSDFYQSLDTKQDSNQLQEIINLPQPVLCCLAPLISYLKEFNLDRVLHQVSNFSQFSTKSKYMQLNGDTIRNLEIFHNATDNREHGSLFWALNQTQTKPGTRLLRTWITRPLICHSEVVTRQDAVAEILSGGADLDKVKTMLAKLPDLERGLSSIYYRKCSPVEFYTVCTALETVYTDMTLHREAVKGSVTSKLLQQVMEDVPGNLEDIKTFSQALHEKAARENDKQNLFVDESRFPAILERKKEISDVLQELQGHRRDVRLRLRQPSLEFTTVLGTEFLIEVKNSLTSIVPSDWTKVSSTKAVSRYHSPYIVQKYKQLSQLREKLTLDCTEAWLALLDLFEERYQCYRKAVQQLSTLDCLFSMATVAHHHGYCRPEIVKDDICIEVKQGRHPVIQQLLGEQEQYVPNDTDMKGDGHRVMIITGPNMGGKSSYIKQTAIMAIMAQTGSFLPAQSARLGIFDAVHTRMGAADEIFKGRSTFMVELQEASEIIAKATPRSLVIMDELGRGTSTHDGVAIAYATLHYLIKEASCLSLFVTHYPLLAELESRFPDTVGNYHMSFLLADDTSDTQQEPEAGTSTEDTDPSGEITFLYQLVPGTAHRSYGLNVAKLANIPTNIVKVAAEKSHQLEERVEARRNQLVLFQKLFTADSAEIPDLLSSS